MSDVTHILSQIESGNPTAAEKLLPLVYDELRKLARAKLSQEQPGQTLQATALVHEAYLRLVGNQEPGARDQGPGDRSQEPADHSLAPGSRLPAPVFSGRSHFFAAAAEAMRRILVERARRNQRLRHGGEFQRHDLDAADAIAGERTDNILKVDAALDELATLDPQAAAVVKLRFFVGMSNSEAAVALGVSTRTVERSWVYAKAWLRDELSD